MDDDDFLWAHWVIYFRYSRQQSEEFSKFLFDEHFTTQRVAADMPATDDRPPASASEKLSIADLQGYATSLQGCVREWHRIHFPQQAEKLGDQLRRRLERLGRLGRGAFEPLLMAAMRKYPDQQNDLEQILDAAERFIFICRFSFRRSDAGDVDFYRLASDLYHARTRLVVIPNEIDQHAAKFMDVTRAIIRIDELFRSEDGFYSWNGLRYFLYEYEQELKRRAGMVGDKINWADFIAAKGNTVHFV